jgi:hypothetical protein
MKNRTTFFLLILFFAGLIGLWWAESAKLLTNLEARRREGFVLPELLDIPAGEIGRVAVVRGDADQLVFERREGQRWQMVEPVDAMADRSRIDALIAQLKGLKRRQDAETIRSDPAAYGLDHPSAVVRLFGAEGSKPLATLELGKTSGDSRYVREAGQPGIEVVEARPWTGLDQPANEWREKSLFGLSTFEVEGLSVRGPDRTLDAQRTEGQWHLLEPIKALADNAKMEGVIADLASLQVADGAKGYVAEDVRDLAAYGLDHPQLTITLTPTKGKPQIVVIGKNVPGKTDRAYARRADQDDVVLVDTRTLRDLATKPNSLRSQRIADLDLEKIDYLEINEGPLVHALALQRGGWREIKPSVGEADDLAVRTLLAKLNDAQTSEFRDPTKVKNTGLDHPTWIIKVWQGALTGSARTNDEPPAVPKGEPVLSLRLGRRVADAKIIYAQLEGDPVVLVLLDNLLEALPRGPLAFRDRRILAQSPHQIDRFSVRREGRTFAVEAKGLPNDYQHWRMTQPVEAPADAESIMRIVALLSGLRAESLVTDSPSAWKTYGLDEPEITVTWSGPPEAKRSANKAEAKDGPKRDESSLYVGKLVEGSKGSRYARVMGQRMIFTLPALTMEILNAELHDRQVFRFNLDQVSRLVLRWPGRSLSFLAEPKALGGPPDWKPETGSEGSDIDGSRIASLAQQLAALRVLRFTQYQGPIAPETGLAAPRLTIEVFLSGESEPRRLFLGTPYAKGAVFATTAAGRDGAVFLLAGPEWPPWLVPPRQSDDLPENIFPDEPPPAR